ncbi:MAG: nitroreductase family protein [Bacteroidales bacterium]|jgi:nitroreductase|nr:nitroreductase family protein [Bacteroidales bacterium]
MQTIIRKLLPAGLRKFLRKINNKITAKKYYNYDLKRYLKYSSLNNNTDDPEKLIRSIMLSYHIIEKGLTMPETKLGFGKDVVKILTNNVQDYIAKYGSNNIQLIHAQGVLNEYIHFHINNNYTPDKDLSEQISKINILIGNEYRTNQRVISNQEYFNKLDMPFPDFSQSRHSIRNFTSENIDTDLIIKSIDLARNTPTACNRQPAKVHIYEDKERIKKILDLQGGSRGFSHLVNVLLIISVKLDGFGTLRERNAPYIDGGFFSMNLLYALHYHKIGVCTLNCSNTPDKDKLLRELSEIPDNEEFVVMLACGNVPDSFKIASSPRNNLTDYYSFHKI